MTDKRTEQVLTAILILNSLLLGVMLFFLFAALSCTSSVLDQQLSHRSFPTITVWAVNFRPKDLLSTLSLIIATVGTSLFMGLFLRKRLKDVAGALLYFAVQSSFWLLAGAYFLFFVMAVVFSQIHVYGSLYTTGHEPPPPPSMITAPCFNSHTWLTIAVVYSVGLLVYGITVARRRKESDSS